MMTNEKALGESAEASSEAMADLIQQARVLRDTLDDFISGTREPPGLRSILRFATPHLENGHASKGLRRTVMEEGAACEHRCPQHPAPVDPSVWSRLPEELLEHVFVRLPVADICRLQCLSKRWQQKMTGRSHFKIACAEMNSRIIAVVHESFHKNGNYCVKLYDVNENKWHIQKLSFCVLNSAFQTLNATDGGLVCFLSLWEEDEEDLVQIVVYNPLSGEKQWLKRGLKNRFAEMLQIITNRSTGQYKVLVGARAARSSPQFLVELFDSQTNEWTTLERPGDGAPPGAVFFGINYERKLEHESWNDIIRPKVMDLCVFDCAKRELNELKDDSRPSELTDATDYAIVGDRLYVLQENEEEGEADHDNAAYEQVSTMEGHYCFTEYKMQTTHPHFVDLGTVQCIRPKLPRDSVDSLDMCVCEGYVMVVWQSSSIKEEVAMLYELKNDEWHVLPRLPIDLFFHYDIIYQLLCAMRWDACCKPKLSVSS